MYRLVNIPHAKASAEIISRVDGCSVKIDSVDMKRPKDDVFASLNMGDLYIGEHMFERPDALRAMVGQTLVLAITTARDVGYRQAQADIREALGVKL